MGHLENSVVTLDVRGLGEQHSDVGDEHTTYTNDPVSYTHLTLPTIYSV